MSSRPSIQISSSSKSASSLVTPSPATLADPPMCYVDGAMMDYFLIKVINTLHRKPQRLDHQSQFLFRENAAVDEEEEATRTRLEAIGLHVGMNFAERLCRDRSLFTETLDVIKFVCKDLWTACWDRQVDNLRTNHRGIYVLQDNAFKTITRLSSSEGQADATCKAKLSTSQCLWA
ncbi:hypothetical protein D9758_016603 [Tetrapyrgos nigripes]|uniref:Trafficking protein particle complex subunit 6B n=1 Tax=Tetrapyrgos nigripes TaxID=182062 RepID=A0A8H5CHF2_9AGAR|nr:hypothetical protein D9758_016603 [Tetrapyrgos nigripes]